MEFKTKTALALHMMELEESIIMDLKSYLGIKYRGNFVAITYDKKIIESASSRNEMLEKLKDSSIPNEQFFVYGVPLK